MTQYITIRPTNLVNVYGNPMGNIREGITYTIDKDEVKVIKNISRRLVETNRYIPVADIKQVGVTPPPPDPEPLPELDRMLWQKSTDGGLTWVTFMPLVKAQNA